MIKSESRIEKLKKMPGHVRDILLVEFSVQPTKLTEQLVKVRSGVRPTFL